METGKQIEERIKLRSKYIGRGFIILSEAQIRYRNHFNRCMLNALCKKEALRLASALNEAAPGMVTRKDLMRGLRKTAKDQTEPGKLWFEAALRGVLCRE